MSKTYVCMHIFNYIQICLYTVYIYTHLYMTAEIMETEIQFNPSTVSNFTVFLPVPDLFTKNTYTYSLTSSSGLRLSCLSVLHVLLPFFFTLILL